MNFSHKPREIPLGDMEKLTKEILNGKEKALELWGDELINDKILNSLSIPQAYAYCLVRGNVLSTQIEDAIFNGNSEDGRGHIRYQIEERTLLEAFIEWNDLLHDSLVDLELSSTHDCFVKINPYVMPYYLDFVIKYSEKYSVLIVTFIK